MKDIKEGLASLHSRLVEVMLTELEYYRDHEIPVPAADKQAIIALLKHNDINASALEEDALELARAELAEGRKKRESRIQAAINKAASDLDNVTSIYKGM